MRVTHVIPNLGYGGAEMMLRDLAVQQAGAGLDVTAVVLWPESPDPLAGEMRAGGVTVTHLGKRPGPDLRVLGPLRRSIAASAPDVVHSHREVLRYLCLAGLPGRPPWVHTLHNSPDREAARLPDRWLRRVLFHQGRVTPVALTDSLARVAAATYGLTRCAVVGNGIPVSATPPRLSDPPLRWAFVGRLWADKNPAEAVRVVADARRRFQVDITLDVFGDGALRPGLERMVRDLGLTSAVRFHGNVNDVRERLPGFDVLLNTSVNEGQPISMLEAMAAGVSILAAPVGGVPDLLGDGSRGYLAEHSGPHRFHEAVGSMFTSAPERLLKQRRAQAFVHANASAQVMADAYAAIYAGTSRRTGRAR